MVRCLFDQIVAERVGQRRLMEPTLLTPSAYPGDHRAIGTGDLMREGTRATRAETTRGDRLARIHLDEEIASRLSGADLDTIRASATSDRVSDGNTRSRWHALADPLAVRIGGREVTIRVVQIKGVVFDSREPLQEYLGTGWRPEYYFANTDGVLCRYFPCLRDKVGTCYLTEAVREFVFVREACRVFDPACCSVPVGIGWGIFPGLGEGDLGFSILGLPTLSARGAQFYAAYDAFVQEGEFGPLGRVLHQRARALGYANRLGFAMPFRHFHNTSLTEDGTLFMHDLGDQGAVLAPHLSGPEQFIAEAFTNLAFAIAPLEHIVDGAPRFMEVRRTIADHLDLFAQPTVRGYFDDAPEALGFGFEDVQRAFRAGFSCRMSENPEAFAQVFCRSLAASLPLGGRPTGLRSRTETATGKVV